jgi:hypothetical protein
LWNGCIWLKRVAKCGVLWTPKWTFRFHVRRDFLVYEWLLTSRLCSVELVTVL